MRLIPVLIFLAVTVSACGEKKEVKDTVFGTVVEAKDKARAVEDKLKQAAEKNRESLKESEEGAAADPKGGGY